MLAYFDLNKHISPRPVKKMKAARVKEARLSLGQQALMYLGVFIGVFFSSTVSQFQQGEAISLDFKPVTLLVSAIVALVIIPVVYEKLKLNAKVPILVQFGLFVQNGVFWQVIIEAIGKVV